jgi:aconitase B
VGMAAPLRVGMLVTSGMAGMVMRVVCHTSSFPAKIRMNCHEKPCSPYMVKELYYSS